MISKSGKKDDKPKSLSKASLYTSLAAYNQTAVDPTTYMKRSTKSVEGCLYQFYHSVSRQYHRHSDSRVSKNTGSRPLNQQELSDRLRQRTLTLVGGGINSIKRTTTPKSKSLKRKRTNLGDLSDLDPEDIQYQNDFMERLNSLWNQYATAMIGTSSLEDIYGRAVAVSSNMEWVGARVRVIQCLSHPRWVGREGILIDDTANAWTLVECLPVKTMPMDQDESAGTSTKDKATTIGRTIKRFRVPKKGTTLEVRLLSLSDRSPTSAADHGTLTILLRDDSKNHKTK